MTWKVSFVLVLVALAAAGVWADGPAIGIDLGTTYSCVGVWKDGVVHIIPNDQGNRITPSWVAFKEGTGEKLVGEAAKNQAPSNPGGTFYDSKRLLGHRYDDPELQNTIKHLPFAVGNKDGKPVMELRRDDQVLQISPEEISAMILIEMKSIAEGFLGTKVTDAVITVPAYFNDGQRQATKDAGRIAGLNVLRVLNEPTAAAVAFGLDSKLRAKTVLVFDLGGGTFDVSLLKIDGGDFRVLATAGDTHLGGEDFDARLIEFFVQRFQLKHERDLRTSPKAIAALRREAEKAKRSLSAEQQVRVEIEGIMDGIDFSELLTRAKFESLNKDLFKKTVEPIKRVLKDTDIRPAEVDHIVMVGGSSRIPYIRDLVKHIFSGREPVQGVNPDEAIAYGAAVQAAVLSGAPMKTRVSLYDVTPLSLGIRTAGNTMANLINRNTPTPAVKEKVFSTSKDDQRKVSIAVYEGERPLVKDNHKLGEFELVNIPPGPRGSQRFKVIFEITTDGILNVTAYHIGHGSNAFTMTIDSESNRLSEADIKEMLEAAQNNREQDILIKKAVEARNALEAYCFQLRNHISNPALDGDESAELLAEQQGEIESAIADVEDYVSKTSNATPEEYAEKTKALKALAQPLVDAIRDLLAAKAAKTEAASEEAGSEASQGDNAHEEPADDEL